MEGVAYRGNEWIEVDVRSCWSLVTRGLMFSINGFIYSETQKPFRLEVCCYVRHKANKDFESLCRKETTKLMVCVQSPL